MAVNFDQKYGADSAVAVETARFVSHYRAVLHSCLFFVSPVPLLLPYSPCSGFVSSPALHAEAKALLAAGGSALPASLHPSADPASAWAPAPGAVRHVYVTSPGDGPRVLAASEALADPVTGLPHVTADKHSGQFDKAL